MSLRTASSLDALVGTEHLWANEGCLILACIQWAEVSCSAPYLSTVPSLDYFLLSWTGTTYLVYDLLTSSALILIHQVTIIRLIHFPSTRYLSLCRGSHQSLFYLTTQDNNCLDRELRSRSGRAIWMILTTATVRVITSLQRLAAKTYPGSNLSCQ